MYAIGIKRPDEGDLRMVSERGGFWLSDEEMEKLDVEAIYVPVDLKGAGLGNIQSGASPAPRETTPAQPSGAFRTSPKEGLFTTSPKGEEKYHGKLFCR
ncbi:MAG: hypothetical protein HQL52_20170 [Magnetococcales bacterium]|nr:hypothetical protein [Magnetococcales bacterium]